MSTDPGQPSEEELRAAYEAEIKRVRVEQILLENIVTLVNLGMRKTGIAPGTEDERDPGQVQVAIEAIRVQLPLVEQVAPQQVGPIRDALSQLQMAYVRIGGGPAGPAPSAGEPSDGEQAGTPTGGEAPSSARPASEPQPEQPKPGEPGPAQRSGKLWIPGQ